MLLEPVIVHSANVGNGVNAPTVFIVLADVVDCRTTCMRPLDFIAYGKGRPLFGWGIADVEIYDVPKPLSAVWFPPETYCEKELCGGCPHDCCPSEYGDVLFDCEWKRPLKRPPQSWCYVEEL